jgi:hypothetical protein
MIETYRVDVIIFLKNTIKSQSPAKVPVLSIQYTPTRVSSQLIKSPLNFVLAAFSFNHLICFNNSHDLITLLGEKEVILMRQCVLTSSKEETKIDDQESRNTGVYQRCSKFVFIKNYYSNTKLIMLYNLKIT